MVLVTMVACNMQILLFRNGTILHCTYMLYSSTWVILFYVKGDLLNTY